MHKCGAVTPVLCVWLSLYPESRFELCIILGHNNVNCKHRRFSLFWGEIIGADTFDMMHSEELVEAMLALSMRFQKLDLSQTETIILSCVALFFPGTYGVFNNCCHTNVCVALLCHNIRSLHPIANRSADGDLTHAVSKSTESGDIKGNVHLISILYQHTFQLRKPRRH